ncbi:MAG: WD40 repeat domain-containing protein [Planctomycetaceae bacterium]|nr:WD40 repeat domain-containing protein [Planctomycetaceae bacterium]
MRYDPDNPPRIDFQFPDGFGGSLVRSNLDSPFVAIRPLDSRMRTIYDLRDNSVVGRVADRIGNKRGLSPDGRLFAIYDPNRRKLELFDTRTGRVLQSLSERLSDVRYLRIPSSRRLVCVTADELTSWSLPDLARESSFSGDFFYSRNTFSPGGRYLAYSPTGRDKVDRQFLNLQILDLMTGEVAGNLSVRHNWNYHFRSFSPDGYELALWMGRDSEYEFYCWSMKDGTLTDHFVFERTPEKEIRLSTYGLHWFPDRRRLWLHGAYVLDRDAGGIVWNDHERLRGELIGRDRVMVHQIPRRGLNRFVTELLPEKQIAAGAARFLRDRQKAADQATEDQPLSED